MKSKNADPKRGMRGFTLTEMVIVVVVIGIIAAMAVPSFLSYIPKLKVKSAARDIVSQMRLARSRSVAERKPYGVYFDVANNCYCLFEDTDNPAAQTYTLADSTIKSDTLEADVTLVSCTYTNACVVFNSTGAASTSGDLKLVTSDGSILMSINTLASTGRVRLAEVGS
jgi:type II secretion system protein H